MKVSIKGLKHYLYFVLGLGFFLSSSTLYFYYDSGLIDGSSVASIHENTILANELQNKKAFKDIKNDVNSGKARRALQKLEQIESKTRAVRTHVPLKAHDSILEDSFIQTKNSIKQIDRMSDLRSFFIGFQKHVGTFKKYVEGNNWRTLTRLSNRINARISGINQFTLTNVRQLRASILKDLRSMKVITLRSVLARNDKVEVVDRLEKMIENVKGIDSHTSKLIKFDREFSKLTEDFDKWIIEVTPQLSLSKLQIEKKGKTFVYLLMFAFFVSSALLIITVVFNNRIEKILRSSVEDESSELIQKHIVNGAPLEAKRHSAEFVKKVEKVRDYLHKRISFSNIYQDTLPFPALLLSNDLQVTWANSHLYELLDIKNNINQQENMSWDYLQKFTNLGEDDPIYEALKNDVCGIYQVQVKVLDNKSPFEMYVSPINVDGEKNIMIFLYSLSNMEQTINNQLVSLIGPVSKTLDCFLNDSFEGQIKNQLYKDFEIAEIEDLYGKFCRLSEYWLLQRKGLLEEIENIEGKLHDQFKMTHELERTVENQTVEVGQLNEKLSELKRSVVRNSEHSVSIESKANMMDKELVRLIDQNNEFVTTIGKASDSVHKANDSIYSIVQLKGSFIESLEKINENRSKAQESINQTLLFLKSGQVEKNKLSYSINKIKADLKTFDQAIGKFEEDVKKFDVKLSKTELLLESDSLNYGNLEVKELKTELFKARNYFEELRYELGDDFNGVQNVENSIVNLLKDFDFKLDNMNTELTNTLADIDKIRGDHIGEYSQEMSENHQVGDLDFEEVEGQI